MIHKIRNITLAAKIMIAVNTFIMIFFLFYSVRANIAFSEGEYHLFMDEYVSFDQVQKIYKSDSLNTFLYYIADGDDHRYGRLMYNLDALISYLPYHLFGSQGQIVATRIFMNVSIILSYWILIFVLLKNNIIRIIVFFLLHLIPFTSYYATMPKPEPLQLLCFSFFILLYVKNDMKLGWYFFFLGTAFGLKISMLPAVVVLYVYTLLNEKNLKFYKNKLFYKAVLLFFLGLALTVPILFLIPLSKFYLYKYLIWTFLSTGHGSDQAHIGFGDWVLYLYDSFYYGKSMVMFILAIIAAAIAGFSIYKKEILKNKYLLFLILSASLAFPIMLTVKRIWGFYLFIPSIFFVLGIGAFIDAKYSYILNKKIKYVVIPFVLILMFLMTYRSFPGVIDSYKELENRDFAEVHLKQKKLYKEITSYLNEINNNMPKKSQPILLAYPPEIYRIPRMEKIKRREFLGGLIENSRVYEYIIISEADLVKNIEKKKFVMCSGSKGGCFSLDKKFSMDYVALKYIYKNSKK